MNEIGYVIVGTNPDNNQPTVSEIYINKEDAEKQLAWYLYNDFKNDCNRVIYKRIVNSNDCFVLSKEEYEKLKKI